MVNLGKKLKKIFKHITSYFHKLNEKYIKQEQVRG